MSLKKRQVDGVHVALVALATIGVVAIVVTAGSVVVDHVDPATVRTWTPTFSAVVATAALLLAAYSYNRTAQRQRKAATMEAWQHWQDATRKLRRSIAAGAGPEALGLDEARALLEVRKRTLESAEDEQTKKLIKRVHDLATVLNGLERIAAGCETGLYDPLEVERMGKTIVLATHDRYATFIQVARTADGLQANAVKQPNSFAELEKLCTWLRQRS